MARKHAAADQPDPRWTELTQKYAGHTSLHADAIYALPVRLIDAIKKEAPKLFQPEDEEFERTLAAMSDDGFFLKRPFSYSLLPYTDSGPQDAESRESQKRWENTDRALQELTAAEMKSVGWSDLMIQRHLAEVRQIEQKARARQRGYAGWLVTHPEFHRLRHWFRERWEKRITRSGEMPAVPRSLMGENPPAILRRDREFYSDSMQFYRDWSLERLVTWDLPVPLQPELVSFSQYDLRSLGEAGVTLFVPWYLLADKDLQLHELAKQHWSFPATQHLKGWLGGESTWGHERFGIMLTLHVYLELALKRRYGAKLRGQTARLDAAFARLISDTRDSLVAATKADSIRKIRQKMNQRLRQCHQTLEEDLRQDDGPGECDEQGRHR